LRTSFLVCLKPFNHMVTRNNNHRPGIWYGKNGGLSIW
jgi:hypothetical protein